MSEMDELKSKIIDILRDLPQEWICSDHIECLIEKSMNEEVENSYDSDEVDVFTALLQLRNEGKLSHADMFMVNED